LQVPKFSYLAVFKLYKLSKKPRCLSMYNQTVADAA